MSEVNATRGHSPGEGAIDGAMRFALIAAPSVPIAAINLLMQIFIPPYYATHTGISLAAIGFAFMILRLTDMFFDPLLGIAIDRTSSPIGRFRPWLLSGVPVVILGVWLTFFPPASAALSYLIVALIFIYAGHSLILVTQYAWAANLASDSAERARIFGWIQAASVLGILITQSMTPLIKTYFPKAQDLAVPVSGVSIIVLVPLTVVAVAVLVPEPKRLAQSHPSISKSIAYYGVLLSRLSVLRAMGSTTLFAMASGVSGALFLFFATAKGISHEQAGLLLLPYFLAAFLASRLWTAISKSFGNHNVLAALCAYTAVVELAALWLPQGGVGWAALGQFALGISYSGTLVLQRAIVGDIAQEAQRDLGDDLSGHIFALYTTLTKAGVAVPAGLAFVGLQWIGYVAKAGSANLPSAVHSLELAFVLLPAALTAGAGLAMIGFRTVTPPAESGRLNVSSLPAGGA
jgi:Na+/melibiose symporter-like transporter